MVPGCLFGFWFEKVKHFLLIYLMKNVSFVLRFGMEQQTGSLEVTNEDFIKGLNTKYPGALEEIGDGEWVLKRHDGGSAYTYLLSEQHGIVSYIEPTDVKPDDIDISKVFKLLEQSEKGIESTEVRNVLKDERSDRGLVVGDSVIMFDEFNFGSEDSRQNSEHYRFLMKDLEIASNSK